MSSKYKDIYKEAIDFYGMDSQINQCIEEMAELTKALNKFRRYNPYSERKNGQNAFRADVLYEKADVMQMLEQIAIIFDETAFEEENNRRISLDNLKRNMEYERNKENKDKQS